MATAFDVDEPSDPPPPGAPPSAIAALFGLSASDAELVEEICSEALAARGVDGRGFFNRLREGARFDAALGLPPGACEALYARAHRWFAVGRPEKSEPLFRALCVADPTCGDYWVGLGICLRLSGQLDMARLALETAGRLRPDWAVPAFHLCELSLTAGDPPSAAHYLSHFRRLSDEDTPAQMTAEAERLAQALDLRPTG